MLNHKQAVALKAQHNFDSENTSEMKNKHEKFNLVTYKGLLAPLPSS